MFFCVDPIIYEIVNNHKLTLRACLRESEEQEELYYVRNVQNVCHFIRYYYQKYIDWLQLLLRSSVICLQNLSVDGWCLIEYFLERQFTLISQVDSVSDHNSYSQNLLTLECKQWIECGKLKNVAVGEEYFKLCWGMNDGDVALFFLLFGFCDESSVYDLRFVCVCLMFRIIVILIQHIF
eukprot:TRINITY_DN2377_c0_g1_i2.p2 TRINITY_DN2377_c0_g1~~TRINITY_DN2377_c0_g1_i2.p2  ORF type:complete len:180 (-),score=3.84 TRINITY_DN2377_c0_g1_i2:285-824(-)